MESEAGLVERRVFGGPVELFLLRHGEAEQASAWTDAGRPLSGRGRESINEAARAMSLLGLQFELILSSPLVRAIETAEIVREKTGSRCEIPRTDALLPDSSLRKVYPSVASSLFLLDTPDTPRAGPLRVLLVGHQPLLGELCADLMGQEAAVSFGKGMLVHFELGEVPPRRSRLKEVYSLTRLLSLAEQGLP
ncbi:MAG: hypothetical protein DMF49_10465 [Acidobacteria bacterium]|nr:MAG: hypothetical protein DMF49_10465 [Acidobacteriota bacterium]